MALTIDCGEGKHVGCVGEGTKHFLIPQLDGERFTCACPCHDAPPDPATEEASDG